MIKFNYKNKRYRLRIYKAKNVIGFGLWFGYRFTKMGYSSIYINNKELYTKEFSRTFSFYFPFFVFAFYLTTSIIEEINV